MAKRVSNAYQKVQAKTANPAQRVLMVYKGIAKNIRMAISYIKSQEPQNIALANDAITLAADLISELKLALDKERGGDVAVNLEALYDFWTDLLFEANNKKDASKLEELIPMIDDLTEGWEKVAKEVKGNG